MSLPLSCFSSPRHRFSFYSGTMKKGSSEGCRRAATVPVMLLFLVCGCQDPAMNVAGDAGTADTGAPADSASQPSAATLSQSA